MSDLRSVTGKIFLAINKRLLDLDMTKIDFAKKLGTSRQNYDRMENEGDMKLSYLQKISKILGVQMPYWFVEDNYKGNFFLDSQVNIGTNSNVKQSLIKGQDDHLKQQNKHLQELLKSKEDQLKGKEEIINVYREQIEQLKKLRK